MPPDLRAEARQADIGRGARPFPYLRPDEAIESRLEDRLGRRGLAEDLASQIVCGPAGPGVVMAVVGEWGTGKTSVVNMVCEAVRETSDIVVLSFVPWLFSGTEELVTRFLQELGAQLLEHGKEERESRLRAAGDAVLDYAEALEPLSWLPAVGAWATRASRLARAAKTLRSERRREPSVYARRDTVRRALAALDHKVLVVVDDLDRLEAEQIRDVMRLVRLVGNFPNTTYLLAYSRTTIEMALSRSPQDTTHDGAAYLEKIVQAPHDLPNVSDRVLWQVFAGELDAAICDIDCGPLDEERWLALVSDTLRFFLTNVRAGGRLLNIVPTTLRLIGPEIELVDVVAMEAVRLFVPAVWELIPESVSALTGWRAAAADDRLWRLNRDREQIERLCAAAGDRYRSPIEAVLRLLFPRTGALLDGRTPDEWRAEGAGKRVASGSVLISYLRRQMTAAERDADVSQRAYENLGNRDRLEDLLRSVASATLEMIVTDLQGMVVDAEPDTAETAVTVFLNELPRLREERSSMFDFTPRRQVERIVVRLLGRLEDERARLAVVKRVLPQVKRMSERLKLIELCGQRDVQGARLIANTADDALYCGLAHDVMNVSSAALAEEGDLFRLVRLVERQGGLEGFQVIKRWCDDDRVLVALLCRIASDRRDAAIERAAWDETAQEWYEIIERWLGGPGAFERRIADLGDRASARPDIALDSQALDAARCFIVEERTARSTASSEPGLGASAP